MVGSVRGEVTLPQTPDPEDVARAILSLMKGDEALGAALRID